MAKKDLLKRTFLYHLYKGFIDRPIINAIGGKHAKRALLSYSVVLMKSKRKQIHPNHLEIASICGYLDSHGYSVDVYNNTDDRDIDYSLYDLIIGEGLPISNYFSKAGYRHKKVRTVYYATGSHPHFQNDETQKRLYSFYREKGVFLPSSARMIDSMWGMGASLADAVILIGNETTRATYLQYRDGIHTYAIEPPIHRLPAVEIGPKKKKNKFLWFGSNGLLHKGLDITLDAFIGNPEIELDVCGFLDGEKEFLDVYSRELKNSPNIRLRGFLDIYSREFAELMEECSFTILASCSEGMATGVLTCMSGGGIIPVVTEACGIDMSYGIRIRSMDREGMKKAIDEAEELTAERVSEMAKCSMDYAKKRFTIDAFKEQLGRALDRVI